MENVQEHMESPPKKSKLCVRLGILPQVVRVVSHVKDNLNSVIFESIVVFKKDNEVVFAEIARLNKEIRDCKAPVDLVGVVAKDLEEHLGRADVQAHVEKLALLKKGLEEYKDQPANKVIMDKLKDYKKNQYRMNSKAINRLLVVVHQVLTELVEYGVSSDSPKIYREAYNVATHPKFSELPAYPAITNIVNMKPPSSTTVVKKKIYYKSAVESGFKAHRVETSSGKKVSLVMDTKEFIADVIYEFVNKMTFYIKNLTDNKRVKTITDSHVDLALKFMFYHEDPTLVKHQVFVEELNKLTPLNSVVPVEVDSSLPVPVKNEDAEKQQKHIPRRGVSLEEKMAAKKATSSKK
jgi:hypothetical protein